MICFLTSRPDPPDSDHTSLNPANRFLAELLRVLPQPCRVLNVCSNPDGHAITDYYSGLMRASLENAGIEPADFRVLDSRNDAQAAELIRNAELLILSGGHVPTQNRFFQRIGLRALMKGYDGVVLGISAGSMNSADVVYAQPEEEGEAVDPAYRRFLTGLGLTKTMLLPHYQKVRDDVLDGLRLFEDITFSDSRGRTFYAIPDGSYLFIKDGREELRGETYRIRDGRMTRIAAEGERVPL